jgi:hypothetical protein
MREVAKYLTPVQRARLFAMRDRLHHRVREVREHGGMRRGKGGRDHWKAQKGEVEDAHE